MFQLFFSLINLSFSIPIYTLHFNNLVKLKILKNNCPSTNQLRPKFLTQPIFQPMMNQGLCSRINSKMEKITHQNIKLYPTVKESSFMIHNQNSTKREIPIYFFSKFIIKFILSYHHINK